MFNDFKLTIYIRISATKMPGDCGSAYGKGMSLGHHIRRTKQRCVCTLHYTIGPILHCERCSKEPSLHNLMAIDADWKTPEFV